MVKDDLLLLLVDTESSRSLRYNIWKVWDLRRHSLPAA